MKYQKSKLIVFTLTLIILGGFSVNSANAQLGGALGNIGNAITGFLGGGGQTVRIVEDISPNTIANTLSTELMKIRTALTGANSDFQVLKERVLDPLVWSMSQQLQQQITGDLVKWLNGQQPGQNGKVPFLNNVSDYYGEVGNNVAGEVIFGSTLTGLCSEKENFKVRKEVYDNYVKSKEEKIFSCIDENSPEGKKMTEAQKLLTKTVNCDGNTICAIYKGQNKLAERQLNAALNEKQVLDYSRGLLPQRVCTVINDPDGYPRRKCDIVNPPFLESDIVSFNLAEAPGLQLLNMDEIGEVVSGFMSSLTSNITQGFGGILSLGGNPDFLNNIFGPNGALSYADALIQDDVTVQQSGGTNPIADSLRAEQRYTELQNIVVNKVTDLETQLASSSCSISLPNDLNEAKNSARTNLQTSAVKITFLTSLNEQYLNATSSSVKNAVVSTYLANRNSGGFTDDYQNQQLESTYINYTFAQAVNQFQCDLVECGAAPPSSCVVNTGT